MEINSTQGSIRLKAKVTAEVSAGVIAIAHGWGHQGAALSLGLGKAFQLPGANINDVIPGGSENMEPMRGQAIMLSHLADANKVERI